MVGAGGGFILVPALLLIMNMSPAVAAGTGLVVVMINALSGASSFIRQTRIDYVLTIFIVLGALPGSFIGVRLANVLAPELFYGAFATMLILLGLFLFWKNTGSREPAAKPVMTMTAKRKT